MSDGTSMIFFADPAFTLADAARVLGERGLTVDEATDRLRVQWGGPVLTVSLNDESYVQGEANDIGAGTPYAEALSKCDRRFEIGFDDLYEALDEINTLIEVQTTLQDATQGIIFNTWNGSLSASP